MNGSYWRYKKKTQWQESRIGKGSAVLLSDGDQIRLCDDSCYVFSAYATDTPPEFMQDASYAQEKEIEVCHTLDQRVSGLTFRSLS